MATSPRKITRTINGSRLLASMLQGKPFVHVPFTTLNEALGIFAGTMPLTGDTPTVRYYAIGINGHVNRTGSDGGHYTQARKHSPDDFGLYQQIPFLLREPGNDLTQAERASYGCRKIISVNGVNWVAYYLKRIPIDNEPVKMFHNTVVNGVLTQVPFVPTNANLHPQPRDTEPTSVNSTDGTYLSTSSTVKITFSPTDVANLTEVAEILFGSPERALISELALVAGCDRPLSITDPGQPAFNMMEVVMAQITTHITGLWPVAYTSEGFDYDIDLGGTEPLIGISTLVP